MKKTLTAILLCLGLSALSAYAALESSLGGQAVYDTDLNITWLADANLAASNTFGVSGINADGTMNWSAAQSWIGSMNAANYLGYHDWRLPTTMIPDSTCQYQAPGDSYGYNCTGSEMGHLFFNELGGVANQWIANTHNTNYGLLQNVQNNAYWSGTEYAPNASTWAWRFGFANGYQAANDKLGGVWVWAVRPGDVATAPLPAGVWLLGSGLLGLIGVAQRKGNMPEKLS